MNWQNILKFFENDSLSLTYSGVFNDKTLMSVISIIANHYGLDKKLKTKNIYIAIEIFQNIIKYANVQDKGNYHFFQTRRLKNGDFMILSSNIISNENAAKVKQRIDKINDMSLVELKQYYKEILLNKEYTEKGGAGLGLIEMRRKTMQNIDYKFIKLDENNSVFLIIVKYINEENENIDTRNHFNLENIWKIHKELVSKDQLLVGLKHNFSEELNNHIFNLLQILLKDENLYNQKLLFSVNVEILQNISKYAEKTTNNEGYYFLYKTKENNYKIDIGNYILNENVDFLKNFLKLLKNSNKSLLDEIYREGLREGDLESAGLGYIDLARMSKKMDYQIYNFSEDYSFFVLHLYV